MKSTLSENVHAIFPSFNYRKLLSQLDSMLQDGHPLMKIPDKTVLYGVHAAWLKLRVWINDIDQEKTNILAKLPGLSKSLSDNVEHRLKSTDELLSKFENQLTNVKIDSIELKKTISMVLDEIGMLSQLAEPLIDLQEENTTNEFTTYVQQALETKPVGPKSLTRAQSKVEEPTKEIVHDSILRFVDIDSDAKISPLTQSFGISPTTSQITRGLGSRDLGEVDENVEFTTSKIDLQASSPTKEENDIFTKISEDEVRLAILHPGDSDKPLKFSIFTVKLFDLRNYEYQALSYAWTFRPADRWNSISIRNRLTENIHSRPPRVLEVQQMIRQDTYDGLNRIRDEEREIIIWADAVCVDLRDPNEKCTQSANYAEIFYHAKSVILWLGEPGNLNKNVYDAFDSVDLILQNFVERPKVFDSHPKSVPWFSSLMKMMDHEVFSRRWIVQELVLARTISIRCGGRTLDWERFVDAVQYWTYLRLNYPVLALEIYETSKGIIRKRASPSIMKAPVEIIIEIMRHMVRTEPNGVVSKSNIQLEELVISLSGFSSVGPKGAVHAFVSLAADTMQISQPRGGNLQSAKNGRCIVVEDIWHDTYKMTVLDTFIKFVKHCIENSNSLDIICCHWAPSDGGPLPSWIKETDRVKKSRNPVLFQFARSGTKRIYCAANYKKAIYRIEAKLKYDSEGRYIEAPKLSVEIPYSLFVSGIFLGVIVATSSRIVHGLITRECFELGGLDFPYQETPLAPDDIPTSLWRTLVADRAVDGQRAPKIFQRLLAQSLNDANDGDLETGPEWTSDSSGISTKFLQTVHDVTYNRKLFRVGDDETLGLGPAELEAGDMVCILFGCSVPVILRQRLVGIAPYFELVGECFVHGVMDGEAIQGFGMSGLEKETREFELW